MRGKKIICAAAAVLTLLFNAGAAASFIDVPEGFWAKSVIDSFSERGIVNGYGDGSFRPYGNVSRAEFCKLIISTFNQGLESPEEASFADVPKELWAYPYIETCKDFLTGYNNPFGGKPLYHPDEAASREDIAVALVKMMGFSPTDTSDPSYAVRNFTDGYNISPDIRAYVSIAAEKKLINGYEDGSFHPAANISRAETVAMLNRATKQAVTDIEAELRMSAEVGYSGDGRTATVTVTAEPGTSVTVDGQALRMSEGALTPDYEGRYVYTFEAEGTKEFNIVGTKPGKTKNLSVTAKYEIGVPRLVITNCPEATTDKTVRITGTMSDDNYGCVLTLNGEYVMHRRERGKFSWAYDLTLETEGTNVLQFELKNEQGRSVAETRKINFILNGPKLSITSCPETSTSKEITITGTMSDKNYGATLTLNGEYIMSTGSYSGPEKSWRHTTELKEGENTLLFELKNEAGKVTSVTKTVTLMLDGPKLIITNCPESSVSREVTLTGTISDKNYGATLTINDEYVTSMRDRGEKSWRHTTELDEGTNTLIFELKNEAGKVTSETRTIEFSASAPELVITGCPETVTSEEVTLTGVMSDRNYGATLYINGEYVMSTYSSSGGKKSWRHTVSLREGSNTIEFVLKNDAGKTTSETRTIIYEPDIEPEQSDGDAGEEAPHPGTGIL